MNRRNFLKTALLAISILPVLRGAAFGRDVPRRTLGRTGEKVSIVGIGGYHLGGPNVTEAEASKGGESGVSRVQPIFLPSP
jgi:hypothetical protein